MRGKLKKEQIGVITFTVGDACLLTVEKEVKYE